MSIFDKKNKKGDHEFLVKKIVFSFKLIIYLILCYILYEGAVTFYEFRVGEYWPFLTNMLHMFIFLPIHEAGHFIFMFFGKTMMLLGGSFLQVAIFFIWFLIAFRQKSQVAAFALFWSGYNLLDVSLYIRDAQKLQLPLLGGHKSHHDWLNLLSSWNAIDSADTIADVVYFSGLLISIGSIAAGIILAFYSYLQSSDTKTIK